MGNRAIITLEDENERKHPVALHVQWNGGLESIEAFMQVAWEAPRNSSDLYDFHVSLCQLLRNYWPDGLCLYAHPLEEAEHRAGGCNNGHYHYRIFRSEPPQLVHWSDKPTGKTLEDCVAAARQREYWTDDPSIITELRSVIPNNQRKYTENA